MNLDSACLSASPCQPEHYIYCSLPLNYPIFISSYQHVQSSNRWIITHSQYWFEALQCKRAIEILKIKLPKCGVVDPIKSKL